MHKTLYSVRRVQRALQGLALAGVTGLTAMAAPTPSQAQSLAIENPGFEADVIGDGAFVVLQPTGWQRYDPFGLIDQGANSVGVIRSSVPQTYFPGGAPEGAQAALVYLAGAVSGEAGLQQTLSATLQAQTVYTLSVEVGNIGSGTSLPGSTGGAGIFYDLEGFPGYRIELLAAGVVLAADSTSTGAIPEGDWRTATLSFSTGAAPEHLGQALGVRLINLDLASTPGQPKIEVDFDHVRLIAAAVPEPGSWALMLLGLGALPVLARRRARGLDRPAADAVASPRCVPGPLTRPGRLVA